MEQFSCEIIEEEKLIVARPNGYLDESSGTKLEIMLKEKISGTRNLLLLDLSGTPIINSSGLSRIFAVLEKILENLGGKVAFCGLSVMAKAALHTTGIFRLPLAREFPSEELARNFLEN